MTATLWNHAASYAHHDPSSGSRLRQQLAYAGVDPDDEDHQYGVLDEAIVPADLDLLYAQDLREILDKYLPEGVKFTMIAGNSHSLLELDAMSGTCPIPDLHVLVTQSCLPGCLPLYIS